MWFRKGRQFYLVFFLLPVVRFYQTFLFIFAKIGVFNHFNIALTIPYHLPVKTDVPFNHHPKNYYENLVQFLLSRLLKAGRVCCELRLFS